ncbi:MAG: 3-dehydroquinate synthase [Candidatus Nitrohelix vancouverensis]|uniref:3-dehydroquinate synthase n=1 Tax=Candidatus Nitrohelix vancouverensis TaxID=2705534 RepID=A0A7T0G2S9_9BACT|nr:MAG: 3-dehydroquinate synthase [Candidatus Nitrohelix vancouverensis]
MKQLRLDLGARSYDILIAPGLLKNAGALIKEAVSPSQVVVITHPTIRKLYGAALESSLKTAGFQAQWIEIPEGESSKSLEQAGAIFDSLFKMNCDRKSLLVALGGGVIGDITGFVAATWLRGVPFVQIPTTLLSQVDSSVGGKTAVNHPQGKNLIGAFYQPRRVIVDLDTLKTLPENEFKAGLAEVVKYGVIEDADFFEFLENNAEKILKQDPACLERIVETSCAVKALVVEKDETESSYRMILNYGHTIGHAVEALTHYTDYLHGEAVALGMVYAARLSNKLGKCSDEVPKRIEGLLDRLGLPVKLPKLDADAMIESMGHDKKAVANKIRFILVQKLGAVEITSDVPFDVLKSVLTD